MMIERILYPVSTLGPGERLTIWTSGCSKGCPGCISPEMWQPRPDKDIPHHQLVSFAKKIISQNQVDGITISGGDPLEQPSALLDFIAEVHSLCRDILIFTGYTLEEIKGIWNVEQVNRLMAHTAVLVDGKYVDGLNDGISPLRGSTNQQVNYFDENMREKYEHYMKTKSRQVQNVYYGDMLVSVGIPNKLRRCRHGKKERYH